MISHFLLTVVLFMLALTMLRHLHFRPSGRGVRRPVGPVERLEGRIL